MSIPNSKNARLFYRAAKERFEDAELLLSMTRTTGAVYLDGYSVECMIKALILSASPRAREDDILAMFCGRQAHDFRWLMRLYQQHGGTAIPNHLRPHWNLVARWSTDLRYSPQTIGLRRAKAFIDSATKIIKWIDGRLSTGGFALVMARYDRSKKPDAQVQQVLDVLAEYERTHPKALIEARRDEYDFIFIRIIDPSFGEVDDLDRESEIWALLNQLPSEVLQDIMMLVPVTPEEAPYSGSSIEFDHPLPALPIPNFLEESTTTNGHQSQTLSVPLEPQEAEAVKRLAASEGLTLDALIQAWVRERLQLSPSLG